MINYFVVNHPAKWRLEVPGIAVISAKDYLASPEYSKLGARIFNFCRSTGYQSLGYYVSLLAEAREHKVFPTLQTIQDLKSPAITRILTGEFEELIQKSLSCIQSKKFILTICFGHSTEKHQERLSRALFDKFQTPLFRVLFIKGRKGWRIEKANQISASELSSSLLSFATIKAIEFFQQKTIIIRKKPLHGFDLAILTNKEEETPPSNQKAIKHFLTAAVQVGFQPEIIDKHDLSRVAQFDALFIRESTNVNNHTYRFARRASAKGLIVIDDPISILKCSNKVYLAELFSHHHIPTPKSRIVHAENGAQIGKELGYPYVLKQPDGFGSKEIYKVHSENELSQLMPSLLSKSDLLIAQEFLPTQFDWRIGVFNQEPIYACRYYMTKGYWMIRRKLASGESIDGAHDTLPLNQIPKKLLQVAIKAANLIGDGIYGLDIKEVNGDYYVMEINDNPSIDAGVEDQELKENLYKKIMSVLFNRVEHRKKRISA
jgi:glutathione synthase/RimK-type ligase-like ATP-grasp enzyme